jgi:serine/threonine protein kinase
MTQSGMNEFGDEKNIKVNDSIV